MILKQNANISSDIICNFLSFYVNKSKFPFFKQANITPVFKKGYIGSKESYRPMSILPDIAKLFEKLLSKQWTKFADQFLKK